MSRAALCAASACLAMTVAACAPVAPAPSPPQQTAIDAPPTPSPPAPPGDDAALLVAQDWLAPEIRSHDSLDVAFDGPAVDLTPPLTLDFERGSGHGGTLEFDRLSVGEETTKIERVEWQSESLSRAKIRRLARRAEVATSTLKPLLDSVRALSRARLTERPRSNSSGSFSDFFVLARICGADAAADRAWEYAGYPGTLDAVRYAAVEAVVRKESELLSEAPWRAVPREAYRATHFSDAFARNRDVYAKESHSWVTDLSIQALGWFGDRSALPTLAWIQDNVAGHRGRKNTKTFNVLANPARYLDGPTCDVPGE